MNPILASMFEDADNAALQADRERKAEVARAQADAERAQAAAAYGASLDLHVPARPAIAIRMTAAL
jgi:hypothetical protein